MSKCLDLVGFFAEQYCNDVIFAEATSCTQNGGEDFLGDDGAVEACPFDGAIVAALAIELAGVFAEVFEDVSTTAEFAAGKVDDFLELLFGLSLEGEVVGVPDEISVLGGVGVGVKHDAVAG